MSDCYLHIPTFTEVDKSLRVKHLLILNTIKKIMYIIEIHIPIHIIIHI